MTNETNDDRASRAAPSAPDDASSCPAEHSDTLYEAPAFYRLLFDDRQHDLPFYLELASRVPGPILELGAGTGRVTLPLGRQGHVVTAVDRSPGMLNELRALLAKEPPAVRDRIDVVEADARALALGRTFGLVLMPFNALGHFHTSADLDALFAVVRAHLAPGGSFAFDALAPDPLRLAGSSSTVPWFRHPRTGDVCRADEHVRYDEQSRVVTIETTVRYMQIDCPDERLVLRLRQFQPHELDRIVARRGFAIRRRDRSLTDATGYECERDAPYDGASD